MVRLTVVVETPAATAISLLVSPPRSPSVVKTTIVEHLWRSRPPAVPSQANVGAPGACSSR
jgi:hypothetical protein